MLEVVYHHAKFGGVRILPAAGVAKKVDFLSVRHAFAIGCINSSNRMTYRPQKERGYGHVTVLKFCRLPSCSASRVFVSDS